MGGNLLPLNQENTNTNSNHIPCSLEAEQAVLGGLLLDNNAIPRIYKSLSANDFYIPKHQLLFEHIGKYNERFSKTDVLMLSDYLRNIDKLSEAGDEAYILGIAKNTPSASNIEAYAKIVLERSKQRWLLEYAEQLKQSVQSGDQLTTVVQNAASALNKLQSSLVKHDGLKIVTIAQLLSANIPQKELILEPWLPKQGLAMIFAPRGIGKTHIALNIGYAVATGSEFLGWKAAKPRRILYMDGEMPASAMQERLASIVKSFDKEDKDNFFRLLTPDMQKYGIPDLATIEGQQALEPHTQDAELIIIDNISTICRTGKENDAQDWLPIQDWALRMRAAGRAVLFIHHAAKNGNQRGTSKREDILDTVISLERPDNYDPQEGAVFEIHFQKARGFFGEQAQPMLARLQTMPDNKQIWQIETLEKTTFNVVVNLALEGLSQVEIATELELNKSTVSRHIKRAKAEGLIQ